MVALTITSIIYDVNRILKLYFNVTKLFWFYLFAWSNNIMKQLYYLVVSGLFIYLADFGFDARTKKVIEEDNQKDY